MIKKICAAIAFVLPVGALASESSVIAVTAQNGQSQFNLQPNTVVGNSGVAAVDASYTFNGLMNNGTPGTMTYAVSATAQAIDGGLHASYSTTVTNVFYNALNSPYSPVTGVGVPTALSGQANAHIIDLVSIAGDPGLTRIKLRVEMDGSLQQSSDSYPYQTGYVALWQPLAGSAGTSMIPGSRINTLPGGTYDNTILTNYFNVVSGSANIDLLLQIYNSWLLQYIAQGEKVSSTIAFFNTARIVGVEGFDSTGNSVMISSAIGASGTNYLNTSPVPLPAGAWLLISGIGGLGAMVRRRKVAAAA
jgi:hypothetical protein